MSRCDYDVIFYRVFCVSLLVIAFIFTVILTNVFVDIDGLLSKKEKAKSRLELSEDSTINLIREAKPEIIFNEDKNYEDAEDSYRKEDVYEEETYRNKRSLEAKTFLFHLQNPNVKNILTTHLNALLEQMDAEEFKSNYIGEKQSNDNDKKVKISNKVIEEFNKDVKASNRDIDTSPNEVQINDTNKADMIKAVEDLNDKNNESKVEDKTHNEMLHLAMHDILLQGIIGHMDLNEVYKKFNVLKQKFDISDIKHGGDGSKHDEYKVGKDPEVPSNVESRFFEELIQCKDLQNQIRDTMDKKDSRRFASPKAVVKEKPQMVVKTLIDINSNDDKTHPNSGFNSKEVKGIIKLIYNGKPLKVKLVSNEENNILTPPSNKFTKSITESTIVLNENEITDKNDEVDTNDNTPVKFNIPQTYLNKAIANYFTRYYLNKNSPVEYSKSKRSFNNKRFKRHIKIHYDPKHNQTKSEDDELYVEIETHFDSKGMKGEKRKKMIRNLIEKIENAIHSNVGAEANKTKKHFHSHVKKRIQNPLAFIDKALEQRSHDDPIEPILSKKIPPSPKVLPSGKVEHRHLDPIGKSVDGNKNDVPKIHDKIGDSWKRSYMGPGFLTPAKSLNSAEMSEVDVDYNRVMTFNGIPQRLQKPLNTENSDEIISSNFYDLGNLKFVVKDMEGSGISVGFNQFTDEEPDPETIKIFTGVDNLVKVYNHNYGGPDQNDEMHTDIQIKNQAYVNNNNEMPNDHTIIRRSAIEEDYHSNEYKMIYDNNYLPYDNYKDIFERKKKIHKKFGKKALKVRQIMMNNTDKPLTMDIFNKKLKPSEIFSLANLLEEYRKKRSFTVKKYSNLNTRRKLNKFLQTKTNKLFINKKRLKRHIDKIRIIATDKSQAHRPRKQSEEQNIFVVSNEDQYSNRAVLREVMNTGEEDEPSDRINDRVEKVDEIYDFGQNQAAQKYVPTMFEDNPPVENYITHIFDGRSRHNPLMSKYPHVFMEEISKSKESEVEPPIYGNFRNAMTNLDNKYNIEQYDMPVPIFDTTTQNYYTVQNISTLKPILSAPSAKTKYKLSVKILPKNLTELKAGFKEIHTSINKSYDKDGLRFYSVVNVSEISKIENLETIKNKGKKRNNTITFQTTTIDPNVKAQQFKIKSMLKRHKQMIDLQLDHLNKEKAHLDNILIVNQSDSDELLDLRLPGDPRPVQLKKSEVTKLIASLLRNEQNQVPPVTTRRPDPITTTVRSTTTTTMKTTVTYCTTPAPIVIPNVIQVKATDKKLINIIEKNGKLTKEILNKIDRNTEMLETFLVKLIDRIDKPVEKSIEKPIELQDYDNRQKEFKMYPTRPNFGIDKNMEGRNDTNFAVPFIYAYQHPYANPDKSNPGMANIVYHGHIHPDNSQNPNEVSNGNPKTLSKDGSKNDAMKRDKVKFFIDNDLSNGFHTIGPLVKPKKYVNYGVAGNTTDKG